MKFNLFFLVIFVFLIREVGGQSLRVATFNLYYKTDTYESKAAHILKFTPDLVFLQEVTQPVADYFDQRLRPFYPHRHFRVTAKKAGGFGILSRFPLKNLKYFPPPQKKYGFLCGLLQFEDREIPFANIHLRTPEGKFTLAGALDSLGNSEQARLIEITEIQKQIPAGSHQLIAGDFNSFSFQGACALLREKGFLDIALTLNPRADLIPTWRSKHKGQDWAFRIDYLFARGLKPLNLSVHPHPDSDHALVLAEVEVK